MKKDAFLNICRSKAKKDLTEEDLNFLGSIGEAVESAFTEDKTERDKKFLEIENKLGTLEEGKTFSGIVRDLATAFDALEAKSKRGFDSDEKYRLKKMLMDKKDEIQRARKGDGQWSIEFRAKRTASALMTTSTVLTGATAFNNVNIMDDLELVVIQYPKNFILDAVTSRQVSNVPASVKWKEQTTAGVGVTTAVSEGAEKPLVDKKFVWKYADRVKYAGRIEMSEELEIDFEQLVIQIITMFEDDVIRVWQDAVLAAIIAWADTYTSTILDGTIINPTNYAVIEAGKLHIRNNEYEPDVLIMNPGDAAAMLLIQDNNGAQQFIPESLMFGGLTPIFSNKITAGKILIGTKRTVKEQHGNFIVRKGVYGNQFIENESTIVGEVFSILQLPTLSQPSWIYLDIATVKAALLLIGA